MARPRIQGLRMVCLRLREADVQEAKRRARRDGVPYQVIVRQWVAGAAASARALPAA